MSDAYREDGLRMIGERLARMEERSNNRDEALGDFREDFHKMQTQLDKMQTQIGTIAGEVRDAKTALRVALALVIAGAGLAGWLARMFWTGKW